MRKPCCKKEETNKGAWSQEEDQKLIAHIQKHGEGCWRSLPKAAGIFLPPFPFGFQLIFELCHPCHNELACLLFTRPSSPSPSSSNFYYYY